MERGSSVALLFTLLLLIVGFYCCWPYIVILFIRFYMVARRAAPIASKNKLLCVCHSQPWLFHETLL